MLALLTGCVAPQILPVPPVPPVVTVPIAGVVRDADAAKTEVAEYVAWPLSAPTNVDRLAILSRGVDRSVARMRAGGGRLADVRAARRQVRQLRGFLTTMVVP